MRGSAQYRCLAASLLLGSTLAPAQQATLRAHVELSRTGHRLKDASQAVIWLTPVGGTPSESPRQQQIPKLIQKDKAFHPPLLVIPVGGKVEFPNHDPFFHNVFSLFEGKRFDLGLYEAGTTRDVHFDKRGISYIFCNIHPEMSAVVVAVDTPYYGISDQRGQVVIRIVPPGRYVLHLWYEAALPESLKNLDRDVTISENTSTLGLLRLTEVSLPQGHKNLYGRDYDPPAPDNPAYEHP